jgi:pimeloyl-ACP methyl ester carboxylesterase
MPVRRLAVVWVALVLGLAAAIFAPGALARAADAPGTLVRATALERYPAFLFRTALGFADLGGEIPITSGAALYRITYWTRDADDEAVLATGLIALPFQRPLRGVVSYLHGTTTKRRFVPSTPNVEGRVAAATFAGAGYLLVAPDYIGLGRSPVVHPYLHARATTNAALDLLRAARRFCERRNIAWPESLSLFGASQGGHAVVALQRRLEAENRSEFNVRAVAAAAGAYDLAGISFPFALEGSSKSHPVYLGYLTYAYATIYREPLAGIVAAPYAARLPRLFDGARDNRAITDALPRRPRDLFRREFLDAFDRGEPTWLLTALEENEAFRFAPRAPLRLYYGDLDADVSPEESRRAAKEMVRRGGNARAISVGALKHQDSAFQSVALVRAWFDSLHPHP